MKLSAVVPFYNVERYIDDCLASIAGQTMRDFEVLLVDDGSRDGTRAIAEKYVASDPRFRLITQENQGLGPARNTGMREAVGTYLTFIDSDDVIPHDAWRLMVDRLDRSGSDFAAGDARRFNIHGVRESWVHVGPFAEDRERATVARFPDLASDRMVWNKVYRRTFWEKHGYAFPAMLYEDYPVTLRAYLDASAVEVISTPIYVWRERDEGELSITQRVYELRNIADRVDSDRMVLAHVAPGTGAPKAVRNTVHELFLNSDVGAVVRAMAFSIGHPDHDAVVEKSQLLLQELDQDLLAGRPRLERLRFAMARAGRSDVLRHLIDIEDKVAAPLAHERRGGHQLISFPGRTFADLPVEALALAKDDLELQLQVQSAEWHGARLTVRVRGSITFAGPVGTPTMRAWLSERGSRRTLAARVEDLHVVGNEVNADVLVDGSALLALAGDELTSWEVMVDLDTGTVRRTGPVTAIKHGSAMNAQAWRGDDRHWIVPGRDAGRYIVRTLRPACWITAAKPGYGTELALSGRSRTPLPLAGASLEIAVDERALLFPLSVDPFDPTRWDVHVQLGLIADPRHHDEFVPATTEFPVHVITSGSRSPVHVDPDVPLLRIAHHGREIQLVSGRFLGARIDEMDPQFTIEDAEVSGTDLLLSGRWLGPPSATEVAVLRWHHVADAPEEVDIALDVDGDRFSFRVDAADLTARMRRTTAQDGPDVPFLEEDAWLLSFEHADRPMTAHISNALNRRLPIAVATPDGLVELSSHRKTAARLVVTGRPRPRATVSA